MVQIIITKFLKEKGQILLNKNTNYTNNYIVSYFKWPYFNLIPIAIPIKNNAQVS